MKIYKPAKLVLLPHNNSSTLITKYLDNNELSLNNDILAKHTNQHLYVISDDKIEINDWFYYIDNDLNSNRYLMQCNGFTDNTHIKVKSNNEFGYGDWCKEYCKKIIATTDFSLQLNDGRCLFDGNGKARIFNINQEFIKKYIESYNKGEIIIDIFIEYEIEEEVLFKVYESNPLKLKINQNNTINIKNYEMD